MMNMQIQAALWTLQNVLFLGLTVSDNQTFTPHIKDEWGGWGGCVCNF